MLCEGIIEVEEDNHEEQHHSAHIVLTPGFWLEQCIVLPSGVESLVPNRASHMFPLGSKTTPLTGTIFLKDIPSVRDNIPHDYNLSIDQGFQSADSSHAINLLTSALFTINTMWTN